MLCEAEELMAVVPSVTPSSHSAAIPIKGVNLSVFERKSVLGNWRSIRLDQSELRHSEPLVGHKIDVNNLL